MVVALIDVDGEETGDDALRDVADALRSRLRAHDLVIRLGGNEFLCVMTGLDHAEAERRLEEVAVAIRAAPGHGSISIGVVQLHSGERGVEVIDRADTLLFKQRQARGD